MTANDAVISLAFHQTGGKQKRIPASLNAALEETGADRYEAQPYCEQPNTIMVCLYLPKRLGSGQISGEIVKIDPTTRTGAFA